jgi:hypothetical protein
MGAYRDLRRRSARPRGHDLPGDGLDVRRVDGADEDVAPGRATSVSLRRLDAEDDRSDARAGRHLRRVTQTTLRETHRPDPLTKSPLTGEPATPPSTRSSSRSCVWLDLARPHWEATSHLGGPT